MRLYNHFWAVGPFLPAIGDLRLMNTLNGDHRAALAPECAGDLSGKEKGPTTRILSHFDIAHMAKGKFQQPWANILPPYLVAIRELPGAEALLLSSASSKPLPRLGPGKEAQKSSWEVTSWKINCWQFRLIVHGTLTLLIATKMLAPINGGLYFYFSLFFSITGKSVETEPKKEVTLWECVGWLLWLY